MKACLLPLLLLGLSISQTINECVLGVRVYPFKYVGATQTVEMRLGLKSNCMDFDSLNFFILPYNKNFGLTQAMHPKRVILIIFGKVYQFDFSQKRKLGANRRMQLLYGQVRLVPSRRPRKISTLKTNNLILRTSESAPFTKTQIDQLMFVKNPTLCKLSKTKETMVCKVE